MKNLLIDADDTLWENQEIFNDFTVFFKRLLKENNIPEKQGMDKLIEFDMESYKRNEFGNVYYKESMKKTMFFFNINNNEIPKIIDQKHDELFNQKPKLFKGVIETIEYLKKNHSMYILTKGYYPVQMKKVETSGIEDFFDGIIISTRKDITLYKNICKKYSLDAANTYMIGNSPKSDIMPALEAGLNAIYIPSSSLWELESCNIDLEHPNLIKLNKFRELKEVL